MMMMVAVMMSGDDDDDDNGGSGNDDHVSKDCQSLVGPTLKHLLCKRREDIPDTALPEYWSVPCGYVEEDIGGRTQPTRAEKYTCLGAHSSKHVRLDNTHSQMHTHTHTSRHRVT